MKSDIKKLNYLVARNIKIYFKDKITFFVSLITPLILVVLFITFLKKTYQDSLLDALQGIEIAKNLTDAFTGGWLFASILATSCITVAFCSGMMVYDKINNVRNDFLVAPVSKATIQVSYIISNYVTTLIVCFILLAISLVYLAIVGWYMTPINILMIIADLLITSFLGCLIANCIWNFVNTQGALSAVCTLVSSMYGFICGAYMPLSAMGDGMKAFASFLPGTYSTVLFRNYYLDGVFDELAKTVSPEITEELKSGFDCKFAFFGTDVPLWAMFLIVIGFTLLLFVAYVVISKLKLKDKKPLTAKTN